MKVCIVSAPINLSTGFAIVARNIALGLKKLGYDVSAIGLTQPHGPEIYYGIQSLPILATNLDEMSQLIMNIRDSDPDIVLNIFQCDVPHFIEHAMSFDSVNRLNELAGRKTNIKGFWYTPVESLGLGNSIGVLKEFIRLGGKVVSQCKWGENEMKKENIESKMIYHGVDDKKFYVMDLDNKEIIRLINVTNCGYGNCKILRYGNEETIMANELLNIHKGKFVFLVVAANIGVRKRIERAMKAYAIFLRNGGQQLKDRTLLHIHTEPFNPDGVKVLKIAERLGIERNTIFSYGRWKSGWTDTEMSILYNSSSCHLSASSGEGFGIGTLESMACGIPTVGPNNTSFIELIGDKRGILVGGDYQYIINDTERFLVNEEELAKAMNKMYNMKENEYAEYRKNCLEFAKIYTWEKICLEWDKLFKET